MVSSIVTDSVLIDMAIEISSGFVKFQFPIGTYLYFRTACVSIHFAQRKFV